MTFKQAIRFLPKIIKYAMEHAEVTYDPITKKWKLTYKKEG